MSGWFLQRRLLFLLLAKLSKLLGQKIFNTELVFVKEARDIHSGAA